MRRIFRWVMVCLMLGEFAPVASAMLMDGSIDITQVAPAATSAPASSTVVVGNVTTFSDDAFNISDWSAGPVVVSVNAGNGSQAFAQALTGGDPGSFGKFTTTMAGGNVSALRQTYFNSTATYDPSVSGAIAGMTGGFAMDLLSYTSTMDVFDAGIALAQGGAVYLPSNLYGLQNVGPTWFGSATLFSATSAVHVSASSDWMLAAGSGAAHPNFSVSGSPIQFGLLAGAYFSFGLGTNVGGIDNWTISVTGDATALQPEPGALSLTAAMALVCCCMRREGRAGAA